MPEHVLLLNLHSFISSQALRSNFYEAGLLLRKLSIASGIFKLHDEMHRLRLIGLLVVSLINVVDLSQRFSSFKFVSFHEITLRLYLLLH